MVTLIITLVDKNRMVQVSDRRLTKDGSVHNDKTNKAVCVNMSHVHYAASYTGLAYIGAEREENRTDYWLLDHLGSITRYGEPSVESICRSLGEHAAKALSRLRDSHKPLEVVLVGYDRSNRAFRATVSNMRVNEQGFIEVIRKRFISDVRWFYPWSPTPEMYIAGCTPAFEANDPQARALKNARERVLQHIKTNRKALTEERVALALLWLVRAAHTHKTFGKLIGRDCLSVVSFPKEPRRHAFFAYDVGFPKKHNKDALFTGFYHPFGATSLHHQPHLADWYMDYSNVEADTNPEGVNPSPPNSPVGTNLASRMRIKIHNLPQGPSEEG